jgi:hypothetical protein
MTGRISLVEGIPRGKLLLEDCEFGFFSCQCLPELQDLALLGGDCYDELIDIGW